MQISKYIALFTVKTCVLLIFYYVCIITIYHLLSTYLPIIYLFIIYLYYLSSTTYLSSISSYISIIYLYLLSLTTIYLYYLYHLSICRSVCHLSIHVSTQLQFIYQSILFLDALGSKFQTTVHVSLLYFSMEIIN